MNYFAYRLPGATDIITGRGSRLGDLSCCEGFAVCGYDPYNNEVHVIPGNEVFPLEEMDAMAYSDADPITAFEFPQSSTTREEYSETFSNVLSDICNGIYSKAVAARVIVEKGRVNLAATFRALAEQYPDAFVFCFHTEKAGSWIGASPERLLSFHGDEGTTMALAGTRPAGSIGYWDRKNILEHTFVSGYIYETLACRGAMPVVYPSVTLKAGPVEHLMTKITYRRTADADPKIYKDLDPIEVALALSPTPALSGMPPSKAIANVSEYEKFQRGFYGGFCGPVTGDSGLDLFVNLRSMRLERDRYCLFAGGGLVADSKEDEEWEETERKAGTIRRLMIVD